jgi:2'-5' RNA ligase
LTSRWVPGIIAPHFSGPLAQLVEQWTFNPLVVGSSPTRPTNSPFAQSLDRLLNEPKMQRLFFAWWPSTEVQDRLCGIGKEHVPDPRARLTRCEKIHLTLAFLGPVNELTAQCARDAAGKIHWQRFSFMIDQLGWFSRPRVMWAGCEETPPPLAGLASTLQKGLVACGIRPEHRRFQVHLTLARKVNRPPSVSSLAPIECRFNEFALVESRIDENGATYETLATFKAD